MVAIHIGRAMNQGPTAGYGVSMSLSLSENELNAIKQEAANRGLSVSGLARDSLNEMLEDGTGAGFGLAINRLLRPDRLNQDMSRNKKTSVILDADLMNRIDTIVRLSGMSRERVVLVGLLAYLPPSADEEYSGTDTIW